MTLLMTTLGYYPKRHDFIEAPRHFNQRDVSVVMPVKDNQEGVDLFLDEMVHLHFPGEVIIVDNNSAKPVMIRDYERLDARVVHCERPGPGAARNEGAAHSNGEWILFTDSDCVPTRSFVSGYEAAMDGSLGYAGGVTSFSNGKLSDYYETQGILSPPPCVDDDITRPEYLVTANALVWKPAFERINGFNEDLVLAAGEDVDMAFRLRKWGNLSYAPKSVVQHNFNDGMKGFVSRFYRYGRGNKKVAELFDLDLSPKFFSPHQKGVRNSLLAGLQYAALLAGYVSEK